MTQAAHIASMPRTKNADELRAYFERMHVHAAPPAAAPSGHR